MFSNRLEFLDVLKTQGKPMHFVCFLCSTERVDHEAENPKPISGRLESSLVSRGRSSISTLRCPEVRLELNFEVSRGPIRIVTLISTLMCSWVGGVQRSD